MTQVETARSHVIARTHMIEGQIKPNNVTDPRLVEALGAIPRELFVPAALSAVAYVDEDLEIAPGRYLMEPMIFARLLNAAQPQPSDVVLDIGAGTGYASAVLSQLAGAVVALESDAGLADRANALLAEVRCDNAVVAHGPLAAGWASQAPYDVILINGMIEQVPAAIFDQLAEGGRLVTVLFADGAGKAVLYRKDGGVIGRRDIFDAAIGPLPGFEQPQGFVF